MDERLYVNDEPGQWVVSTGQLPLPDQVDRLLTEAYERYKSLDDGKVADYIPALAATPKDLFGICVVGAKGTVFEIGDTDYEFSIQSISKPFVFALVSQALSCQQARYKIGVNGTGLPFNSVMAIELNANRTMNPMVNAGAIATTSLVPGATVTKNGSSSRMAFRASPVASSRSTRRSINPRPLAISAIRAWPNCSKAMAGCIPTRLRQPIFTRSSARSM